jgi:glucokinase
MDFRAPLSGAGSQGTLENLTGRLAITAEAATYAYRQEARKLFQIAGTDISRMKSKALVNSIKLGDKAIERLVRYRAKILGISMANVVNLLNPELIILGGGLIEALGNIIVKEAKETMQRFALKPLVKGVEVKAATLQDYAIVKGAAALAVDAKEKRS